MAKKKRARETKASVRKEIDEYVEDIRVACDAVEDFVLYPDSSLRLLRAWRDHLKVASKIMLTNLIRKGD